MATSLIPTVLALSEFFAQNFPNISWYPYWYLGNPYHYLIGPVVPTILAILNITHSTSSGQILNIYLGLIGTSFLVGSFGLYLFLREWRVGWKQALISAILYLVLPAGFFLLKYQNGLHHIALAFLPFLLLLYKKFLERERVKTAIFLSIAIAFVLLIDISILLPLTIGFIAIFVALSVKNFEDKIVKTVLILFLAISLSTIWYTPRFWWVILTNPSFGGVPLINLAGSLFNFVAHFVPLVLAILVVRWRKFKPEGYLLFAYLFFASFAFLTVVRFISDPDFVIDWIGFSLELQFGLTIILGNMLGRAEPNSIIQNSKFKINFSLLTCLLILSIVLDFWILNSMTGQYKNDYQSRIISMLKNNVKENERVFLSGSSVFWINSFLNIQQVRGGVDEVSIHPFWAHGAYQIREGDSSELARDWLIALGASYILVHEPESEEPFHDFKNTDRFSDFRLIAEVEVDKLYKIENASIARIADKTILDVPRPKNGADRQTLRQYVSTIKGFMQFSFEEPNVIVVRGTIDKGEVVSLAISYDSSWQVTKGEGRLTSDSLGNMVILPEKEGEGEFVIIEKDGFKR